MAAKRKRSLRGLGRGLEVHASAATSYFKQAKLLYSDAAKNAFSSRCAAAFSDLIGASEVYGVAEAHDEETISMRAGTSHYDHSPARAVTKTSRTEAIKDFKARCLVGKGLSGLAGRRRRRK